MVFKGVTGQVIRMATGVTLTGATDITIQYRKHSGATGFWEAVVSGEYIQYTTTAETDLDEVGSWTIQGDCTHDGWTGPTAAVLLEVGTRLKSLS